MKHSKTRYRFGESDIYTRRRELRTALFARNAAALAFDEALIAAIDDGMSFADAGDAIGEPKASVYRWYQDATRRRETSRHRND